MNLDEAIVPVPLGDVRRAVAAASMLRDRLEDPNQREAYEELVLLIEKLKGYHNLVVQAHGGDSDRML